MIGIRVCYQCSDRYVGCHSKCERYINAKKIYEQQKALSNGQKVMNDYIHTRKSSKVCPKSLKHYNKKDE